MTQSRVGRTLLIGLLLAAPCGARGHLSLTEFPVAGFPGGVVGGPDGAVWFTLVLSNRIGRVTPSGIVSTFPLGAAGSFSETGAITLGSDGALWYGKNIRSANLQRVERIVIGRLTTSGVVVEFPVPLSAGGIADLATGPDGAVWFTEVLGNRIGRVAPDGHVTEFDLPTEHSNPRSIVRGPDDALWFTEVSAIGRITASGEITEFPLDAGARPIAIAAGGDGALWFTDGSANVIWRMTVQGETSRFAMPTAGRPGQLVWGSDGAIWFTESGNGIGRMTTGGTLLEVTLPTPGSRAGDIAGGPDGAVWFTETFEGQIGGDGQIGRVILGSDEPRACIANRTTLCLNGGRFEVATFWTTPTAAGQGIAVPLTADAGYFWFFSENNVEVVVKVLDGCTLNERYWLFAAGLTDVGVYTVVTDTQSGVVRTYENFLHTPFAAVTDTNAFDVCP